MIYLLLNDNMESLIKNVGENDYHPAKCTYNLYYLVCILFWVFNSHMIH